MRSVGDVTGASTFRYAYGAATPTINLNSNGCWSISSPSTPVTWGLAPGANDYEYTLNVTNGSNVGAGSAVAWTNTFGAAFSNALADVFWALLNSPEFVLNH